MNAGVGLKEAGFYDGSFKVKDEDFAHKVAEHLQEFKDATFPYCHRNFILAVRNVMLVKGYDSKHMALKMQDFGASVLRRQTKIELYIRNLEELYNYHVRKDKQLRFDYKVSR